MTPDDGVDPDSPDGRPGRRPLHLRPGACALVVAGGVAGTAARYGLARAFPTRSGHWPTGTFVANLVGAFVLGVLLEALLRSGPDTGVRRRLRLLLGTGFCGGFTTYSTFAVEADLLVRDHHTGLAVGYVAATLVAGAVLSVAGIALAARYRRIA
ncbi:fluoride efflux transporter FluC [uncultured Jatrophihabitans sp.]|uniref:fluoride efflux transporter FluC n=1 Tax=uncultured Jatrophihabitans sp. TaxID=1610747 RepID=UPI0035C9D9D6